MRKWTVTPAASGNPTDTLMDISLSVRIEEHEGPGGWVLADDAEGRIRELEAERDKLRAQYEALLEDWRAIGEGLV